MSLTPTRLRVIRSVGLLLLLAMSVAGFMLLIDMLADTAVPDTRDPLAATETDEASINLPSSASLFTGGVVVVAIIVALALIGSPTNWRRSESGLPRPRFAQLGIALALAIIVAAAGLFLAFGESSPLFQETAAGGALPAATGHEVATEWVAPAGVVILAAFFFSVILIGFLRPRFVLPVLGLWLAAALFFGFFSSSAVAGLSLFEPAVNLKVPGTFASEVARHRTVVVLPDDVTLENEDPTVEATPPATGETVVGGQPGLSDVTGDAGQVAPGQIAEEALIARLHEARDPFDRADAAAALSEYGSEAALEALSTAYLLDPSQTVKDSAVKAIKEWRYEDLVRFLREHPYYQVRRAAAAALGVLDDPRAVEPLSDTLLDDDVASVRQETARALGILGDQEAIETLLDALMNDPSTGVREAAANALARLRSMNSLSELNAAQMTDGSQEVRLAAARALESYTLNELIGALLYAEQPADRVIAATMLGQRRNSSAIPAIIQALNDHDRRVVDAAWDALNKMGALQPLENGNSLLSHGDGVTIVPGTTASQSPGLPHVPVFTIKGAEHTDFLRTSVGEIYTGGSWRNLGNDRHIYERNTPIPLWIPGGRIQFLDKLRLDSMPEDEPLIRPASGESHLPTGILPTGHVLRNVNTDGIFYVDSATFLATRQLSQYSFSNRPPLFDAVTLRSAGFPADLEITRNHRATVRDLAAQITAGHSSAYAKAKAIERHLQENYTYALADETTIPVPPDRDPVDWFLFESREGTCGNFSSAFVHLARSVGLPARVVSGFAITPTAEEQIVFADQAHQRAEIAFMGLGWVPFEPTPGGAGAPERAEEYFASGQAENDEVERLRDLAAKLNGPGSEEALRDLEDAGAIVQKLENGGHLVSLGALTLAAPPGTTADQAYGLLKRPVFTVTGARETGYLVTSTGDVYLGEGWRQLDPVTLTYSNTESAPDLVRESLEDGREPWSDMPESRIEPILLAPDEGDFDNAASLHLRVAPIHDSGRIPAGVVPVSRHVSSVGLDGSYRPFSGTFEMDESVLGYEWWSILPRPGERDLNRARTIEDPTYTQLPDDLDERIHDLARRITSGHRTPYAKARAIERYVSSNYRYVLGKDSTKPPRPAGFDAVEWFLFETREGTCGQFSSAFTVLARSIGLPARVVSGWMISPTAQTQTVYSDQGHQWAEVAFEGIGWITFEATGSGGAPTRTGFDEFSGSGHDSQPPGPSGNDGPIVYRTVTNITSWPREIERGRPFIVGGTVRTTGGASVSGMDVEIFVNEIKANGGLRVGTGTVRNGVYSIEVEIPASIERGGYQLIAHAIANEPYLESWSDPGIAVFSKSNLMLSGPQEVDVGTEAQFRGQVTEDDGGGVADVPLTIRIDGRSLPQQRTGEDGEFSFSNTFLLPGKHWAEVQFPDNDYLRANSARLNLQVFMPTTLTLDVPAQARVDEPFTISGTLIDWRQTPLNGRQVTITVGENDSATVVAGVDGSFTHEVTLPSSGQVTVSAAYEGTDFVLSSSASSEIIARDVTVLSFEGPGQVLAGEAGLYHGTVTIPTNEDLEPLVVEIINGGEIITTIHTGEDGTFSYDTGRLDETGPRMLTARVPEQQFLTSSAATVAYFVVHPTVITLDGPPIAMTGQHVEFNGALMRGDGQPVTGASLLVGGDPVITGQDGTFSHVVTLPQTLGGVTIEDRIGIQYDFEGTDHLAPASGSRSIIVGIPRITVERIPPVARGDVALLRGTAFAGTRPLPGAAVSLTGGPVDETGPAGQFLFEYQVPANTPIGPLQLIAELDGLGVHVPIELDIRSATHLDAMPLDDVRPGRVIDVQVALYDDTGAGISGANLRTSTGLDLITDEFGHALFELTVPESESLLAVPVTFTFSGDARHMPLNQFLGVPVSPPSFNWLLWVVLPVFLLLTGAGGYGVYRLRAAGVALDPRFWSMTAAPVAVAEPVPSLGDADREALPQPLKTALGIELSGAGADTGNVYGLDEEIGITGRLITEDGAPVPGQAIELREPLGDVAMFDTDDSGEFRLILRAEERGEFSLVAEFAGDTSFVASMASAVYRVVDFREEMVRIFGEFMEWAERLEIGVSGQSPRRTEVILVSAGVALDQRALDELVTRFEEADYSEHLIERRHYEAMYRAWRAVIGE